MVHKLKTIRADMLVLQCQLERELIRYVKRYLCQPQVTIITNDKQFAFMCELYDYVENTELPPEMVSSLMKTKNVLELSWDEWMMNIEVEDMEDSIKKVAELLRKGRFDMPYIPPEVVEQARQIDLLTYLRKLEPDNVEEVKGTRNVYRTVDHDSLKMSNGKWFWWSQGFGGYNALDYLIKVRNYSFMDAVEILTGKELANWTPPPKKEEKTEPKVLRLPEKYQDSKRVIQYLFNRGIDYHIIQECIADGVIFESNGRYHNAVFVGKDETGTPKYAAYRGLGSSTFKGDAYGSDKQYSFRLLAKEPCQSVHLFEAAIDLLSYATLLKAQGKDYKAENLLSLSGVYQPKKENKDSKIPIALSVFLEKNPLIKTIHLHLDNDKTGRLCANTLKELLRNKYEVFDEPPKKGKDYNDYLCIQLGIYKSKERSYER